MVESLRFSICSIMSSANSEFYFFCSNLYAFYFFFFLISLSRNSTTVLNKTGECWHPCLVPDLRGKAFSLPLSLILDVGFHTWPLLSWSTFLLYLICWEFLSWKIVEFCQKLFLHLLRWCDFYPLFCFNVLYHTNWVLCVELFLHPRDQSHLVMVYSPFNVLLNLVCWHLVEGFCICVHQGYCIV